MKGILEFNLPEEREEFDIARKGINMVCLYSELDKELRSHVRYDTNPHWDSKTVEEIRDLIFRLIEDEGLGGILN